MYIRSCIMACGSRCAFALLIAVYILICHICFCFADRGSYAALVDTAVFSRGAFTLLRFVDTRLCQLYFRYDSSAIMTCCARYAFASLIVVDMPFGSTRLCCGAQSRSLFSQGSFSFRPSFTLRTAYQVSKRKFGEASSRYPAKNAFGCRRRTMSRGK